MAPPQTQRTPGIAEVMLISSASAVVSKTATAPVERVRLLIQCQGELMKQGALQAPYRGFFHCTGRIFRTEGLRSFWKGNLASCVNHFPSQALNFFFKDQVKAVFNSVKSDNVALNLAKNVMSGAVAGALGMSVVYSMGYTRVRLACDVRNASKGGERQFKGIIDVYRKTLASDGIRGLYRGFTVSCLGIMVYRGFYFGLYDTFRQIVFGENGNLMGKFALGYIVSISSSMAAYPCDTICHRMMLTSCNHYTYRGFFDCGAWIVKNEGFIALWRGAMITVVSSVAGAGMLVGFDAVKNAYIKNRRD